MTTPEPSTPAFTVRPAPLLALAALLLALALALVWSRPQRPAKPPLAAPAPAVAAVAASQPASASAGELWRLAEAAQIAADAARNKPIDNAAELRRMQEKDKAWCAQVAQQRRLAARGQVGPTKGPDQGKLSDQLLTTPEAESAQYRLTARWARLLRARGDERSLMVADWLDREPNLPTTLPTVNEAMVKRAERSSDPMVIALAQQLGCWGDRACASKLGQRWRQLEPTNASAWLAQLSDPPDTNPALNERGIDEMLRNLTLAKYQRNYILEAMGMLMQLPGPQWAGMHDSLEVMVALGVWAATPLPSYSGLIKACTNPTPHTARAQYCGLAAERLWETGGTETLQRLLNIRLAGVQPMLREQPDWVGRARETEATLQWSQEAIERDIAGVEEMVSCEPTRATSLRFRDRLTRGEWTQLREEMVRAKVDEAALQKKLLAGGRASLLRPADPPKPAPSAPPPTPPSKPPSKPSAKPPAQSPSAAASSGKT